VGMSHGTFDKARTIWEKAKEGDDHLLVIERERAKKRVEEHGNTAPGRGANTPANVGGGVKKGDSRDIVAEKIGMSGRTYDKARTIWEKAKEGDDHLLVIERERAKKRQGTRNDIVATLPQSDQAKSRDIVAEKVGMSGRTFDKARTIWEKAKEGDDHLLVIERERAKKRVEEHCNTAPGRSANTSGNVALGVEKGQSRDIVAEVKIEPSAKFGGGVVKGDSRNIVAEKIGMSGRTFDKARTIWEKAKKGDDHLLVIERERAKKRHESTLPKPGQKGFNVVPTLAQHNEGKSRDIVAGVKIEPSGNVALGSKGQSRDAVGA